jgi:hypothetical protein
MGTQDKMVRLGMWPALAQAVEGDMQNLASAAGATQATATALTADLTILTTVGAGTGVVLRGVPGRQIVLNGQAVNALLVYPPVGGFINVAAVNVGFSVPLSKSAEFMSADGITFIGVASA